MAVLLPIFALGGYAVYSQRTTDYPDPVPATEEDRMDEQLMSLLHEYGMSASADFNAKNKTLLMGGVLTDGVGVDNRLSRHMDDPNFDPMHVIAMESVQLQAFDRADTLYAMVTQQGVVAPIKRIAQTVALTEEIYHPDDPSARSELYISKFGPAYVNYQQMMDTETRIRTGESPHELALRSYNGSVFFENAAGVNFRYEED